MEALSLLASLRATRRFRDVAVPQSAVTAILDAARWTGSARNRQPWRLLLVTNPVERAAFSRLGAYAEHLAGAPVVILLAIDQAAGGADAEFDSGRLAQNIMLAAHAHASAPAPPPSFRKPTWSTRRGEPSWGHLGVPVPRSLLAIRLNGRTALRPSRPDTYPSRSSF
jgi:nitroreductase